MILAAKLLDEPQPERVKDRSVSTLAIVAMLCLVYDARLNTDLVLGGSSPRLTAIRTRDGKPQDSCLLEFKVRKWSPPTRPKPPFQNSPIQLRWWTHPFIFVRRQSPENHRDWVHLGPRSFLNCHLQFVLAPVTGQRHRVRRRRYFDGAMLTRLSAAQNSIQRPTRTHCA